MQIVMKPFENELTRQIDQCTHCEPALELGAKPIYVVHPQARIALISQAPGRKAHLSGTAWDDASGERLRQWLGTEWDTFYNPVNFAVVPMGFCYPGRGKSGDLPPRKECAPIWHDPVLRLMPNIQLFILIGQYAQRSYLSKKCYRTLTATVEHYSEYLPLYWPLPHPSPINTGWRRRNPWFEAEVVPALQSKIQQVLRT